MMSTSIPLTRSIVAVLLAFFFLGLGLSRADAGEAPAAYKAGVATKVITPPKPMWMAGYAARNKPAEGTLNDLHAKAVCLEDADGKRLVLVTVDLIGIPRALGVEVAAEVEKKYGVKRAELMLAASHTHCGPVLDGNLIDMYPLSAEERDKIAAYTNALKTDLVELVGAAVKDLEPVTLKYGQGRRGLRNQPPRTDRKGHHHRQEPRGTSRP